MLVQGLNVVRVLGPPGADSHGLLIPKGPCRHIGSEGWALKELPDYHSDFVGPTCAFVLW